MLLSRTQARKLKAKLKRRNMATECTRPRASRRYIQAFPRPLDSAVEGVSQTNAEPQNGFLDDGRLMQCKSDLAPPGLGTGELGSWGWGIGRLVWGSSQSTANEDPGKVPQQPRDGAVGGTDQCERFAKFCMLRTLADVANNAANAGGRRQTGGCGLAMYVWQEEEPTILLASALLEPSLQRVGHHGDGNREADAGQTDHDFLKAPQTLPRNHNLT
ncbi:hypothetical protein E4U35_007536 [Claviceps purpurea]|nr:hypothetical protein E4U35_007536 [Claviceps purpurea]